MSPYLIPFRYLYISRFTHISEWLSLLWIFPIYLVYLIFGIYELPLIPHVGSFLVGFAAWMSIYEIGYMENDAITTQRERFPNFRIPAEQMAFIEDNLVAIRARRLLIFAVLVGLNGLLGWWTLTQIGWFILWVSMARLFFVLHNRIRSRANIATYFGLCLAKYTVFPFLYLCTSQGWEPYLVVLVSFVLLRTTEHGTKEKYGLLSLQRRIGSLDTFRAIYYAVATLLAAIAFLFWEVSAVFVLSLGYFLLFRGAIWLMIKKGAYARQSG